MQNKIFQQGIIKEYQLSGSGNLKTVNYYISGNYYDHSGIVINSNYKKYSLSANAEKSFSERISAELGYRGSLQENKDNQDTYGGNNLIFQGINKSPLIKSTPDSLYLKKDPNTGQRNQNAVRVNYDFLPLENKELTDSLVNNLKS
jgi:hypothetical protein